MSAGTSTMTCITYRTIASHADRSFLSVKSSPAAWTSVRSSGIELRVTSRTITCFFSSYKQQKPPFLEYFKRSPPLLLFFESPFGPKLFFYFLENKQLLEALITIKNMSINVSFGFLIKTFVGIQGKDEG